MALWWRKPTVEAEKAKKEEKEKSLVERGGNESNCIQEGKELAGVRLRVRGEHRRLKRQVQPYRAMPIIL
jgi:hypothetical protein